MAPTVRTFVESSNFDEAINWPALDPDDTLAVLFVVTTVDAGEPSPPSGWQVDAFCPSPSGTFSRGLAVLSHAITGSESGAVPVPTTDAHATLVILQGTPDTDWLDAVGQHATSHFVASPGTETNTGVTTTQDDSLVFAAAVSGAQVDVTTPSGYSLVSKRNGVFSGEFVYSKVQASAGASGSVSFVLASATGNWWVSATLAYKAAVTAQQVDPTGFQDTATFGTSTVTSTRTVSPSGFQDAAAFGSPTLLAGTVTLNPAGINNTTTFGEPSVSQKVSPAGVPPTSTVGGPTFEQGAVSANPSGIAATAAFGTPSLGQEANPTGVASTAALGAPALTPGGVTASPTGVASTVSVGAPSISTDDTLAPASIDTTTAIGTPALTQGAVSVSPTGIASGVQFGVVAFDLDVPVTGIAGTAAIGTPSFLGQGRVAPLPIDPTAAFGTPTITTGSVSVQATGIPSGTKFGTVLGGAQLVIGGVGSGAKVGIATVVRSFQPTALQVSTKALGTRRSLGRRSRRF